MLRNELDRKTFPKIQICKRASLGNEEDAEFSEVLLYTKPHISARP